MLKSRFTACFAAVLLCAGLAGTLIAVDTAPAPADYSQPRQAMKTFLRAQDKPALMDALIIDSASQSAVESFLDVMDLTTKLQKAAEAEFGTAAAKYFSDVTGAQLTAKLKTIDTAEVRLDGDSASVILPADEAARQAASTVLLKKVGTDWKLDAATLFGTTRMSKADLDRRVEIARTLASITNQMITDIKARKFASASDAYQEYWNRSRTVVARSSTTQPATSPEPATRP